MNRDLDAEIAEKIFGWKLFPVGKDANGENAGEFLYHEKPDQSVYNCLPRVGKVHKGAMTPQYSGNRDEAIRLAVKVGMKMDISEIDFSDYKFAEKLAKKVLEFWKKNQSKN